MAKYLHIIIILLCCHTLASCSLWPREKKRLTVMAWNVWHLGHSEHYPEEGCRSAIGIMQQAQADVILMVETYGTEKQVADSLGYHYHLISDNLCIFSRYPILETYAWEDSVSSFNFGGVMIDVDGRKVRLFDTWLHYLPDMRMVPTHLTEEEIIAWEKEDSRDEQIHSILNMLAPMLKESDDIPVIVGGDFNTYSHLDWTPATRHLYHHGGAVVHWPISMAMTEAGFRDSYREHHPDPLTHPGTTWMAETDSCGTECRQDRIDFIYSHGKHIHTISSDCYTYYLGQTFQFHGKEYLYPSDHGFVLTEFLLD